jgi:hypothetical protein
MSHDSFSQRILTDERFITPAEAREIGTLVGLAVRDQLLVDQDAAGSVVRAASDEFGLTLLTSLYADIEGPPEQGDVEIWKVDGGVLDQVDIFGVVERLRSRLSPESESSPSPQELIAPNHVLIPANLGHGCPDGPPHPVGSIGVFPTQTGVPVDVTVIDSGYQWDDESWGPNPIEPYLTRGWEVARRLPTPAEVVNGITWPAEEPDKPGETIQDQLGAPRLPTLAGHANFVAGVVAQQCADAAIRIISHNGRFDEDSDDYPTEASVAHSLCRAAGSPVINVGFAFTTYDQPTSHAWKRALAHLANQASPGQMPIVCVPAGNQGSDVPHFPAALDEQNVIGVGALNGKGLRATFSNHGKSGNEWVKCAVIGQDIVSTFLDVNMLLEDGDNNTHDFTGNSWAGWNGTSFAAPWVAGMVAKNLRDGSPSSWDAWSDLVTLHPKVPKKYGNWYLGTLFQA